MDNFIGDKMSSLKVLYNDTLWGLFFANDAEPVEQHCPSPFGANPEAIAQIAAHLSYNDKAFTLRMLKWLPAAIESADAEIIRGLFIIAESQLLIPDNLAPLRREKLWDTMLHWFIETQRGSPEATAEHLNWLLRALCLVPEMGHAHVACDDEFAFQAEAWLREVETDPKQGYGKAPKWLAEAIDKERRPEVALAASPVGASQAKETISDREAAILPLKKLMVSHVVQPDAMSVLPLREDMYTSYYIPLSLSLRATLLLQRLQRLLVAHGKELLGVGEINRRQEAIRTAQKAVTAAGVGLDGEEYVSGGHEISDITHDLD